MLNNRVVIAIAKQKNNTIVDTNTISRSGPIIVLDDIRDPGNLGTIVRTADWYGIKNIIASTSTVDFWNPKTISSTKGSFSRVNIYYTNINSLIKSINLPTYGTFLEGENIHTISFPENFIIIIGNESNGISREIENIISHKITIPNYNQSKGSQTESLNAGIATAIILDNIKRNS